MSSEFHKGLGTTCADVPHLWTARLHATEIKCIKELPRDFRCGNKVSDLYAGAHGEVTTFDCGCPQRWPEPGGSFAFAIDLKYPQYLQPKA